MIHLSSRPRNVNFSKKKEHKLLNIICNKCAKSDIFNNFSSLICNIDENLLEFLISRGADINQKDKQHNQTVLFRTIKKRNLFLSTLNQF